VEKLMQWIENAHPVAIAVALVVGTFAVVAALTLTAGASLSALGVFRPATPHHCPGCRCSPVQAEAPDR
jgi:hypothetical protein